MDAEFVETALSLEVGFFFYGLDNRFPLGIILCHRDAQDNPCVSTVAFEKVPIWEMDPLTLTGEVHCRQCGLKGRIEHGRWRAT